MKETQPFKKWIRNNRVAIGIAGIFFLLGATRFLPYHTDWVVYQTWLIAFSVLVLGVVSIPISYLLSFFENDWFIYIFDMMILTSLGTGIGLWVQKLWREGKKTSIYFALPIIILLNGFCVVSTVVFSDVLIGPVNASCEQYISSDDGIRIVSHAEYGVLAGTHFFVLRTDDGKNWRQIKHIRWDDRIKLQCDNIRELDEKSGWKWAVTSNSSFNIYTEDNGSSWVIE